MPFFLADYTESRCKLSFSHHFLLTWAFLCGEKNTQCVSNYLSCIKINWLWKILKHSTKIYVRWHLKSGWEKTQSEFVVKGRKDRSNPQILRSRSQKDGRGNVFSSLVWKRSRHFCLSFSRCFQMTTQKWAEMKCLCEMTFLAVPDLPFPEPQREPGTNIHWAPATLLSAGYFPYIKLRKLSSLFLPISSLHCPPPPNHLSLSP